MSRSLPNFLLIGAMKSGTTSVFRYLGQHPEVFVPDRKEPGFFVYEGGRLQWAGPHDQNWRSGRRITRLEEYERLFAGAGAARALGEATPYYLCDEQAPQRIRDCLSEVRLIAILRQPVDRAYSAYLMKRRREERLSFEEALDAEPRRIAEGWGYGWHYAAVGRYAEQLERYLALFPRPQVMIELYDDLAADPVGLMRRLYRYLGVDESFRPDVSERHQAAHLTLAPALDRWLGSETTIRMRLKGLFPGRSARRLYDLVYRLNKRFNRRPAPQLDAEARARVTLRFRDGILRLQDLLGRDLSHWL